MYAGLNRAGLMFRVSSSSAQRSHTRGKGPRSPGGVNLLAAGRKKSSMAHGMGALEGLEPALLVDHVTHSHGWNAVLLVKAPF